MNCPRYRRKYRPIEDEKIAAPLGGVKRHCDESVKVVNVSYRSEVWLFNRLMTFAPMSPFRKEVGDNSSLKNAGIFHPRSQMTGEVSTRGKLTVILKDV